MTTGITITSNEDFPSYLNNCVIIGDGSEGSLFVEYNGKTYCALDNYAIIPIKEYNRLKEQETK